MSLPPHVAVIYRANDFTPLRVYVNQEHEDGQHMYTIQPGAGEGVAVVSKNEVRGLQLHDVAAYAILKATGHSI